MDVKSCTKCLEEKPLDAFYKDKYNPDGLTYQCKSCRNKKTVEWQQKNRKRVNATAKKSRTKNGDKIKVRDKERNKIRRHLPAYKAIHKRAMKKYRQSEYGKRQHREHMQAWRTNPTNKLIDNMRSSIGSAIRFKADKQKCRKTEEYLGCTREELVTDLELQFKPDMSWDNYGRYGWHVDHIRPLASFDLANETQQRQAFHYSNLQPLWAEENLRKSAKI